jgi:hypothetical protein
MKRADGRKKQRKEEQALVFVVPEITVNRRVGRGWFSMDTVAAIEQFARYTVALLLLRIKLPSNM